MGDLRFRGNNSVGLQIALEMSCEVSDLESLHLLQLYNDNDYPWRFALWLCRFLVHIGRRRTSHSIKNYRVRPHSLLLYLT